MPFVDGKDGFKTNLKYRKSHKNIRAVLPVVTEGGVVAPSLKGLFATKPTRLNAAYIEAARMAILKTVGRNRLRMWIQTGPHIPVTKKPLEVRMGKGKSSVDRFMANVKAGRMLFEFNYPTENTAKMAFKQAKHKLLNFYRGNKLYNSDLGYYNK